MKTPNNLLSFAGLFTGIAGIIEILLLGILFWAPDQNEMKPFWFVVELILLYVIPFLISIIFAWKSAKTGGILLIAGSMMLPVSILMMTLPNALGEPVQSVVSLALSTIKVTLPISLPPFITGLLFLFSTRIVGRTK